MKFHVLTLFPEMIRQGLAPSIIGRALEKGIIELNAVDIRDYSLDKHRKVDDYPYGGGAGMLMQVQPVYDAWQAVCGGKKLRTVYVTPQGVPFTQKLAGDMAKEEELVILCGHYEGIDQRVLDEVVTDFVSIGDYVLTGGELPAMVMIDAVSRLVPGVLGNDASAEEESFFNDLLEYPHYSRPEVWHGKSVPEVLLTGNHRRVTEWRLEQSVEKTRRVRPDLFAKYEEKQKLLKALSKDKRNMIPIMESLSRGQGEILYQKDGDVVVYAPFSEVCMLALSNPANCERVYQSAVKHPAWYLVFSREMKDYLLQQGHALWGECFQYLYTLRQTMPVAYKQIRSLTIEDLPYVNAHYGQDGEEEEYLAERILSGAMYGAYDEQGLIGFIGCHNDGSMGFLFVEEPHRGKGIAVSLESFLINRQLERGYIPYCHVRKENTASLHLQEKLDLYRAGRPVWWVFGSTESELTKD